MAEPHPTRTPPPVEGELLHPGETAPRVPVVDPPMVPFAVGGMLAWGVAGLVLLLLRDRLAAHGHTDWLWICLAGFLLGIPGTITMVVHDRNRRRRRAEPQE